LALPRWLGWFLGLPLFFGGIGLIAWAVGSAGDAELDRTSRLVVTGAYRVSRNPMYVGWSASVVGIALLSRAAWLLVSAVIAVRAVDREVGEEEAKLSLLFGREYADYRNDVARYLPSRAPWKGGHPAVPFARV
jgi:protein-S-isoprenylcysteine O-methyltransferase Ste14